MTLENGLAAFLDAMLGKNRSSATLRAYKTDILGSLFAFSMRTMLVLPMWTMWGRWGSGVFGRKFTVCP